MDLKNVFEVDSLIYIFIFIYVYSMEGCLGYVSLDKGIRDILLLSV